MKKIFKFLWLLVIIVILSVLVYGTFIIYEGHNMYKEAIAKIPITEKVEEIREDKDYVTINNIPRNYTNAVKAVEDHRFDKHKGIDLISIGRAIVVDIKNMSLVEGGSTITQQLAKNMYFTQEKEFSRKIAEVFVAFDLEKHYSKDEIIEMYMNITYFGSGYYGIGEASEGYFSKEPNELNLYEITLLAGLPNAPSVYSPNNKNGLANKRQEKVINAMYKHNYITQDQVNDLKK